MGRNPMRVPVLITDLTMGAHLSALHVGGYLCEIWEGAGRRGETRRRDFLKGTEGYGHRPGKGD